MSDDGEHPMGEEGEQLTRWDGDQEEDRSRFNLEQRSYYNGIAWWLAPMKTWPAN